MCSGCWQKNEELDIVSHYVSELLQGKPLKELARQERTSEEEIRKKIEVLRELNPIAYQQIEQVIG